MTHPRWTPRTDARATDSSRGLMVMIFLRACALTWLATSSATSARTGLHGRAGQQRSYWPTKAWRSAPPASQGMNASSLAETASYLRTTNQKGWDKKIANGIMLL